MEKKVVKESVASLNPCSNERYSQRSYPPLLSTLFLCLNPCSNERYSQRITILFRLDNDDRS